ncbi:MAG: 50S ribosomal protein L4 [Candidatus Azambacteria bacterium]|nr:50S ribosomal protein L4 [Candidatus Azambacteria bacterium]
METPVYNQKGEKVGTYNLPDGLFAVPLKESVVHQSMRTQLGNARKAIAHTKDRSEVSGGGKKPWRQKGTGRARHGSIRSPLWKGGGVTFGPRNDRNFSLKINKKQKNKALAMMLSSKVKAGKMAVLDMLALEKPKTKHMMDVLRAFTDILPEVSTRKTLIIIPGANPNITLAARNIPKAKVLRADSMNINDLLIYRYMIISKEAIEMIEKVYGRAKKPASNEVAKEVKRVSAQKAAKAAPLKKIKKKVKKVKAVKKIKKEEVKEVKKVEKTKKQVDKKA